MGLMVNATPGRCRERPGTHCIGGWVGPRAGLDGCGKSRPPPTGFDPRTVQPLASRYTDWAIQCVIVVSIKQRSRSVVQTGHGTVTGRSEWHISRSGCYSQQTIHRYCHKIQLPVIHTVCVEIDKACKKQFCHVGCCLFVGKPVSRSVGFSFRFHGNQIRISATYTTTTTIGAASNNGEMHVLAQRLWTLPQFAPLWFSKCFLEQISTTVKVGQSLKLNI